MKLQSKYDIGDHVYILFHGKIREIIITNTIISIEADFKNDKSPVFCTHGFDFVDYKTECKFDVTEEEIYETKEDLKNYLRNLYKTL